MQTVGRNVSQPEEVPPMYIQQQSTRQRWRIFSSKWWIRWGGVTNGSYVLVPWPIEKKFSVKRSVSSLQCNWGSITRLHCQFSRFPELTTLDIQITLMWCCHSCCLWMTIRRTINCSYYIYLCSFASVAMYLHISVMYWPPARLSTNVCKYCNIATFSIDSSKRGTHTIWDNHTLTCQPFDTFQVAGRTMELEWKDDGQYLCSICGHHVVTKMVWGNISSNTETLCWSGVGKKKQWALYLDTLRTLMSLNPPATHIVGCFGHFWNNVPTGTWEW